MNRQCYQRHIEKGICNKFKKCLDCGFVFRVEEKTDSNGIRRVVKHVCNKKVYCRVYFSECCFHIFSGVIYAAHTTIGLANAMFKLCSQKQRNIKWYSLILSQKHDALMMTKTLMMMMNNKLL